MRTGVDRLYQRREKILSALKQLKLVSKLKLRHLQTQSVGQTKLSDQRQVVGHLTPDPATWHMHRHGQ